jgi:T-complex protein 1 subunit gamma
LVRLSKDGNAVLKEFEVTHPAAKNILELSKMHDKGCRNGMGVIILGA